MRWCFVLDLHVECTFRGYRSLGPPTRREWRKRDLPSLHRDSREPQDIGGKAGSTSHKAAAPSSTVPDDWDEASSEEEDNQMIWDNACVLLSLEPITLALGLNYLPGVATRRSRCLRSS